MNSPSPFANKLFQFLALAEGILVAVLISGLVARSLQMSLGAQMMVLSLAGLGGIYFLSAYKPPALAATTESDSQEQERIGFLDLLLQTIIPKLIWIGCAVGSIGLSLYFTETGNEGYTLMLMIHATVVAPATLLIFFGAVRAVKGASLLSPVLYRAIPLLFAALYILRG
ncbi:MAG: hypothetical protein SH819_01205 [Cytophagales bacterium]|nr:hypothetical protein [Cytophagales bacterium]